MDPSLDAHCSDLTQVSGFVAYHAHYRPTAPAFTFANRTYPWAELNRLVNIAASHFVPFEHVALVMHNSRAMYVALLALMKIGCVGVPLSPLLNAHSIEVLAKNADCTTVVYDKGVELPKAGTFKRAIDAAALEHELDHSQGGHHEPVLPRAVEGRDLAHVMFSSGTTGLPKGICLSHRVRFRYGIFYSQRTAMREESVTMHSGSLVFNGAFVTLMPHLFSGCHFVLMKSFDAKEFVRYVRTYRVTHTITVPTQIFQFLNLPGAEKDLASLQCLISVGAPLPLVTKQELQAKVPNVLNEIYGLTEGFSTYLDAADAVARPSSVGRPMPYARMRIVGDDGKICQINDVGEIQGRSPLMFQGYYNDVAKTRATMSDDGWLKTGDLGYVDAQGFLFLAGRKKDMIISGGVNVYPIDIETVAAAHENVKEVAVFGVEDAKWGETPIAAVILRRTDDVNCTPAALKSWINERVNGRHEKVSDVLIVADYPRNVAGKALKNELQKSYKPTSKL